MKAINAFTYLLAASAQDEWCPVNEPGCVKEIDELSAIQVRTEVHRGAMSENAVDLDMSLLEEEVLADTAAARVASNELFEGCKANPDLEFLQVMRKQSPSKLHPPVRGPARWVVFPHVWFL